RTGCMRRRGCSRASSVDNRYRRYYDTDGMESRLSRTEQSTQNRERILAAARRVFLARGYYGATLEQIAEEAGFTKGAVYSRFEGKADLFLALLEDRIGERARDNIAVTEGVA